jgi:hypothetical protein
MLAQWLPLQQANVFLSRVPAGLQELPVLRFPGRVKFEPDTAISRVIAPVIVAVEHDAVRYAGGKCAARQPGFFPQVPAEYAEWRQPYVHANHPFFKSSASQGSSSSKKSPSSISSSQHPRSRPLPFSLQPQPTGFERTSGV